MNKRYVLILDNKAEAIKILPELLSLPTNSNTVFFIYYVQDGEKKELYGGLTYPSLLNIVNNLKNQEL